MPWGISHKHKFVFIHIPKTAGTTICSSWEGSLLKEVCKKTGVLGGTHKTITQIRKAYPETKYYLSFSVIRNPFSRFVSMFHFKQLNPRKPEQYSTEWPDKEAEGLYSQLYWITNANGEIIVNKLLRYENLLLELKETFEGLELPEPRFVMPHFRQTGSIDDYKCYYDVAMKSLVSFIYREDLKMFNYSW